jgi:hypothetical protein
MTGRTSSGAGGRVSPGRDVSSRSRRSWARLQRASRTPVGVSHASAAVRVGPLRLTGDVYAITVQSEPSVCAIAFRFSRRFSDESLTAGRDMEGLRSSCAVGAQPSPPSSIAIRRVTAGPGRACIPRPRALQRQSGRRPDGRCGAQTSRPFVSGMTAFTVLFALLKPGERRSQPGSPVLRETMTNP